MRKQATMSKAELADHLANETGLHNTFSRAVVEVFVAMLTESLARGDRIELQGFGTFRVDERAARIGRNPRTGEELKIPPKRVVRFKASKAMLERVQEEAPEDHE